MAIVIPTSTTLPEYRQRTSLDGRSYVFRFLHNPRLDRWSFDLADQDESPIVSGRRIVTETDLLSGVADARKPPGILVARDYSANDDAEKIASIDPGLTDLGSRVFLVYITAAEVGAAGLG